MKKLCTNCKHFDSKLYLEPCKTCIENMMSVETVERPNWEAKESIKPIIPRKNMWVLINQYKITDEKEYTTYDCFDTYTEAFEAMERMQDDMKNSLCFGDYEYDKYKICLYSIVVSHDECT